MVSINYATREVCCKIVYYGPGLSGKTTNLQVVHQKVPQNTRGKLISLATEADRTLYFDFLPINIGSINGFAAKFQLYTVPGQVYYNATRKLVLRGVDGVVFVADSQAEKCDDNLESLSNLKENLEEYGYDTNELPIVIQYNKTDLPTALSKEELDAKLNEQNWPSYTAAAVDGVGVFDTLKAIMKLVLEKAKKGGAAASVKPKLMRQPASVAADAGTPSGGVAAPAQMAEAQSAPSATIPAPQPAMAAAHSPDKSEGEDTKQSASVSPTAPVVKSPPAKAPTGASGGLFGAPRSSAGRSRRVALGSGPVQAAVGSSGDSSTPTGKIDNRDEKQIRVESGGSGADSGASAPGQPTETHQAETQTQKFGHDPLEQAPPQPKQKKSGFFRRLFGRK